MLTLSTCAFNLPPEDHAGWVKALDLAMETGFAGFEISMYPGMDTTGIRQAFRDTRAPVIAVHGIMGGDSCSATPEVRENAARTAGEYLERFAEFAGVPAVEHYWNRFNAPEKALYFHETSAMLLEKMEKNGFIFCMENAPYKPEVNERYPDVDEVAAFARSFGENRMFITLDLNHVNLHEDPFEVIRKHTGSIRHVHISDNHGMREEHLPPGQGTIPLAECFRTLRREGFTGPCNLEMVFRTPGIPEKTILAGVFDYCQKIFAPQGETV